MSFRKSVAKKIMTVALMAVAPIAVSFAVNVGNVSANSNIEPRTTVQANNNQAQDDKMTNNNQVRSAKQINNNNQPQNGAQFHRMYSIAKSKLGHKYVYGATGPQHFDCSGFTGYVYRKGLHKTLPRTAQAQYNSARHISANRRKAGDLVFFGGSRRNIYHVGMYIGNGKMIDAQNRGVVVENVKAPWWHAVGYARPVHLF